MIYLFRRIIITAVVSILFQSAASAQFLKEDEAKTGWAITPLPILGWDSDMGFQYGAVVSVSNFGDGSTYPEYKHSILANVSRFTKGSGINQIFYDSKYLLPHKIRITADFSYLTEKALNFYGFNGYQATYNRDFEEESADDYISRMYYRLDRRLIRFILDFQGKISSQKFRWLAGISVFNIKISTVDIDHLNSGNKKGSSLPDTSLLYDDYVRWGMISPEESNGGHYNFFKLGLVYDSRDNEPFPHRGLWEEVIIFTAPSFFWNKEGGFTKLAVTHRQYISIVNKKVTFAYRLKYQGTISGQAPFYFQSYLISSFSTATKPDGLGGSRTIRGALRNRIVGDGYLLGNAELRWKFLKTKILKQNFNISTYAFLDAGKTIQYIDVDRTLLPAEKEYSRYFDEATDLIHLCFGAGLRFAINENFIVAFDVGFSNNSRDGYYGIYVTFNNIF